MPKHPHLRHTALLSIFLLCLQGAAIAAQSYYLDANGGNDLNSGLSPAQAWSTLAKASTVAFLPGDQILLQRGDTFPGKLVLEGDSGTAAQPIVVAAYGTGAAPVINAAGYLAGVHIRNTAHIEVRNLRITANGGAMVDGSPEDFRYGVLLDRTGSASISHIVLDNLFIHDVYTSIGTADEGAKATTYHGYGIAANGGDLAVSGNIIIQNCRIENVGFKGIELKQFTFVEVLDNQLTDIGGPGIQPSRVNDIVVRGNVVDGSGSFIDPRMHGRGSGIWPFASDRVLIERNTFKRARGRADSHGIHIDFNCADVVVQYNLSIDNAGGFIEILGNNDNCSYRYNISINDGWRVVGQPSNGPGTLPNDQPGRIIWTSGYVGGGTPKGPYNSYLYNNTIYMANGSTFDIEDTTDGLLIANNIFYIVGSTSDSTDSAAANYTQAMADRVLWNNNLYQRTGIVPVFNLNLFTETDPTVGNPLFANAGGLVPTDYVPAARALVQDQGIIVAPIPGDAVGLAIGLAVGEDYFGNPVIGFPDMGAIEMGGTLLPLPAAAFAAAPALVGQDTATMTSVAGPYNTEYYFTETSGNIGGDDSGWQLSPVYVDSGLLPNTTYTYTVTMRNAINQPGSPSAAASVLTPVNDPFVVSLLLSEDFSSAPNPANASQPFPVDTWYVAYQPEADSFSVNTYSGALRIGYGYDYVRVLRYTSSPFSLARSYSFTGTWRLDTVLDLRQGLTVGLGAFDAANGQRLLAIKEITVGTLSGTAVAGQTAAFTLNVSAAELAAAGVTATMRVGVYFDHPGAATPNRNDIYSVDNLSLVQLGGDVDSDGDNVPDSAELAVGMNPGNPADGPGDLDGDGFSNPDEFLSGTALNNPASFFIASIATSGGLVQVSPPGGSVQAGRIYILEASKRLETWTVVDAVSGSSVGPGQPLVYEIAQPVDADFYRIRVEWE